MAAGFDPKSEQASVLEKDYSMGWVLVLGNNNATNVKSSLKNQTQNIENFHAYLAYLTEFSYDLAIPPSISVSSSPGFKSFVGVF